MRELFHTHSYVIRAVHPLNCPFTFTQLSLFLSETYFCVLFQKLRNCSVPSQLRCKIHSKSALPMGFCITESFSQVFAVNASTCTEQLQSSFNKARGVAPGFRAVRRWECPAWQGVLYYSVLWVSYNVGRIVLFSAVVVLQCRCPVLQILCIVFILCYSCRIC